MIIDAFSISEAARIEIASIIACSSCLDPVITLRDEAPVDLPADLESAVLKGSLTDAESEELSRRCEQIDDSSVGILIVCVFERQQCRPEDVSEVDGVALAMPVQMRERLSRYCLTYKEGRFMLESPEETALNLSSVKTLA